MNPAVIGLGGGQLLVRGRAVVDLARALRSQIEMARRRDGLVAPARLLELLDVLDREAMAAGGHADVRAAADSADSAPGDRDARMGVLGTEEAATMINLSSRHVRRLAADLGGRRVAGRWVFDAHIVAAFAAERTEENACH